LFLHEISHVFGGCFAGLEAMAFHVQNWGSSDINTLIKDVLGQFDFDTIWRALQDDDHTLTSLRVRLVARAKTSSNSEKAIFAFFKGTAQPILAAMPNTEAMMQRTYELIELFDLGIAREILEFCV
jgi:hypothetical protein